MNYSLDDYFVDKEEEDDDIYVEETSAPYVLWNLKLTELSYAKLMWQSDGRCFDLPPGTMYPPQNTKQIKVATKVCVGCPVQSKCLFFALVSRETNGVWGGTTEAQRVKLFEGISKTEFSNYRIAWSNLHEEFLWNITEKYIEDFTKTYVKETTAQTQA